jgi:hypothetical protein
MSRGKQWLGALAGFAVAALLVSLVALYAAYLLHQRQDRHAMVYPGVWLGPLHYRNGTIYLSHNGGSFGHRFGYLGLYAVVSFKRSGGRPLGPLGNTDIITFDRETKDGWLLRNDTRGVIFFSNHLDLPWESKPGKAPAWLDLYGVTDDFTTERDSEVRGDKFTIAIAKGGREYRPLISGTTAFFGVQRVEDELVIYAMAETGPRAFHVNIATLALTQERELELDDAVHLKEPVISGGSGHQAVFGGG